VNYHNFFTELERHNLYRVAIAYVGYGLRSRLNSSVVGIRQHCRGAPLAWVTDAVAL
jgi:hypothetical protein